MDAPHPLASVIIATQYFSRGEAYTVDTTADPPINPSKMTVDVSAGFTGGIAEGRTYKIGAVTNNAAFSTLSYELEGSTLTMELGTTADQTGSAGSILDISIPIQATDTDGAVATTTVIVRVNDNPEVTDAGTAIALTVGLQDAPTMDGDDDDMDPDDYDGQTISAPDSDMSSTPPRRPPLGSLF